MQDGAHQALADVIARVIILTGEILLADVIEDIVDACYHLAVRQRHRVPRVIDNAALHHCAGEDGSSAFFKAADTIHGDETVVFHTILSPEAEHVRALPDIVFWEGFCVPLPFQGRTKEYIILCSPSGRTTMVQW